MVTRKEIYDRYLTEWARPDRTPSDRVAAYFEHIMGRPMTREEKIPLSAIIFGDWDV